MQRALKKQHRSITVNTYKYVVLLTLISVNGLSISQLEIIMETLHAMKLNTLPFMMHLGMFAMIRKEKRKNLTIFTAGSYIAYIRPVVHTEQQNKKQILFVH